jgi:molybdopterin synthase catalytic subunit
MNRFSLQERALEPARLLEQLRHPSCGGYVAFEGAVRNHNEGRAVLRLEYEAFAPLALREGERILAEACARFGLERASCAHRVGALQIGELAVWVGVGAAHRGEAFDACRYIIDHIKHSVPIWKKEYYEDGDSGWVNCEHCAAAPDSHESTPAPHPHRAHGHS